MPVDAATLETVPLFSSLPDKELKKLIPLFRRRSFEAGHVIAEEGSPGHGFFVIESGRAAVTARGEARASLGPGDHFGEIAALDPGPRVATVTTETELTAYLLDAWDLRQLVARDPALAAGIIDGLVRIVRRLEGFHGKEAPGAETGA